MDHLFISPHLDDAVLSCGGTIHQLTARGDNVTVMTIMAGDPPEPIPETPIIKELHQRWRARHNPVKQRRQEDRLALEHLGAEHEHCVLQDCVYRFGWAAGEKVALYPSEESLWRHVHPEDPTLAFLQTVEIPRDINLYFPLGVGGHVDHLIVRDWGLLLADDPQLALNWYAEYPYTREETAVAAALEAFEPLVLDSDLRWLDEDDVRAKTEAAACYESQISTFWDSVIDMQYSVRDALLNTGDGVPAERFWRVTGSIEKTS